MEQLAIVKAITQAKPRRESLIRNFLIVTVAAMTGSKLAVGEKFARVNRRILSN